MSSGSTRWQYGAVAAAELYSRQSCIAVPSPQNVCERVLSTCALIGFASAHCSDMLSNAIRARKLARTTIELKCMHCSGQIEHEIAPQAVSPVNAMQNTRGFRAFSPLSFCTSLPVAQALRLLSITNLADQQADCPK